MTERPIHRLRFSILAVFFLLLCMVTAAFAGDASGLLQGRVVDNDSGRGIDGASVDLDLEPTDGTFEYQTRTDAFGFYTIRQVGGGVYAATASHPAYLPETASHLTVANDSLTRKSFSLFPRGTNPVFDVYIQVIGATSNLLLGDVPVTISGQPHDQLLPPENRSAITDAQGFIHFRGLPPGDYTFAINQGGNKRPGWDSYTTPAPHSLTGPRMANVLLKPEERMLTVTVYGFNPVTEEENVPLEAIYVEATGVDPADHDLELMPTITALSGITKENQNYWNNTMAAKVEFRKLPPIGWVVRGKRLGYHVSRVDIDPDAAAQLQPAEFPLNMVLQDTRLTVVFNSLYNDSMMLEGLEARLQGLKDTNTVGIDRTATVTISNGRAEAFYDKILPGSYRVTVNGTVEKTVPIIIQDQDVWVNSWEGPKKFTVRFNAEEYVEAFADVNHDVDITLIPQPMTVRGQLLFVDQETGSYHYLHQPRQHDGIEFHASEYFNSHLQESERTHVVDADEKGEFTLTLLPGLYGIRVPNLDDYWGDAVDIVDVKSQNRFYGGWPYYQIWPYSATDVTQGFHYNVGGIAVSSDQELQIQPFMRRDHINLDTQVTVFSDPTALQILAIDLANNRIITTPYRDIIESGGKIVLTGTTAAEKPLEIYNGGIGCRIEGVLPGNYTVTATSPRFDTVTPSTFYYWDHNPPGFLPTGQPPAEGSTARPMLPMLVGDLGLNYKNPGKTALTIKEWIIDEENGSYYIDRCTAERPDFMKVEYAGDRIFKVVSDLNGYGVTPSTPYQVWIHLKDKCGVDGERWYHFNSSGGDLLGDAATIYLDGPDVTPAATETLTAAYDLQIVAVNRQDHNHTINGVTIEFTDGTASSSGNTLSGRTETLEFSSDSVTHPSWTYSTSSDNSEITVIGGTGDHPILRLTLFMNQGIAVRGKVTNAVTGDPIPEAHIFAVNQFGGENIMGTPSRADGTFSYPVGFGHQVYHIEISAKGYAPVRLRLNPEDATPDNDPRELVHLLEGSREIKLTPLTPPEIITDSAVIDRFGAFLPSVSRSGTENAMSGFSADDQLTMTWSIAAKGQSHTVSLPSYDNTDGTQVPTPESKNLADPIKEVWLIDRRSFARNTYNDVAANLTIPDPQNPHQVHAFLDTVRRNDESLANVFYQQVVRFTPTEDPDTVTATGTVKLYRLPPDGFRPAFIVISRLGAVAVQTVDYQGDQEDQQLIGVRMPPWMGFLADIMGTAAGTQATADQIKDFLPEGRFMALPRFTAEITEEDGFLQYRYAIAANLKEGSEGPMSGLVGMAPGMLGMNISANVEAGMNGRERQFSLTVEGGIDRETVIKDGYTPSFFKRIGARVELDPNPTGTVSTTASQQFDPQNQPNEFEITHEVRGEVGAKASVSLMPVLTRIPYVGPVLLIAHRAGLDTFANSKGLIGLRSATTWRTVFPRHLDNSYIIYVGRDRPLRRHFLGGNEQSGGQTTFDLCFGFGVGLSVEAGSRAGGEGYIELAGDDCWTGAPALLVESNPVGDWPPISRIRGDVRATFKAFLDYYVGQVEKEWVWRLIKIDHQFGTETVFQLIEMDILTHERNRGDLEPVLFVGAPPQLIRNFLILGKYAVTPFDGGALLFIDMATNGDMVLKMARRTGPASWDSPQVITTTTGAIVDVATALLPDGELLAAWTEIDPADLDDPFAPAVIKSARFNGASWTSSVVASALNGSAPELHLVPFNNDTALIFLETAEGPAAEIFSIKALLYNGQNNSWGAPEALLTDVPVQDFTVAGTRNTAALPLQAAYTDQEDRVWAFSWNGNDSTAPRRPDSAASGTALTLHPGMHDSNFLAWAAAEGGIHLYQSGANDSWNALHHLFTDARPVELAITTTNDSDQPVLLFVWTEGGTVTTIHYGFADGNGSQLSLAAGLTQNSSGHYHRLALLPSPSGSFTITALFDNNGEEMRHFDIRYPDGPVNNDRDNDAMDDIFELLVVDDDPADALVVIDDVTTDADYDQDGYTNLEEMAAGKHPVRPYDNPGPDIAVSPPTRYFGGVIIGDSSAPQSFTIKNTGSDDLILGTIALTGENPDNFTVVADNCSSTTLAPAATCRAAVHFTPATGANKAYLAIPTNIQTVATLEVPLTGLKLVDKEGDANGDGRVGLGDALLILQILSTILPPEIHLMGDLNDDQRLGLEDVMIIMRKTGGVEE